MAQSATETSRWDAVPVIGVRVRGWTIAVGVTVVVQGAWAFFWPRKFFDDFPVPDAGWLSTLGSFNEHLARDFGAAVAGLGVVAILAGLSNSRAAVRAVMAGFVFFGVPHLGYHFTTFDEFSVASGLTQLATLALFVVVPAVLLVVLRQTSPTSGEMT